MKSLRLIMALSTLVVVGACTTPQVPFDSVQWKTGALSHEEGRTKSRRLTMVDDLCKRVLAKGMPSSEVLTLLGEPSYRWDSAPRLWSYALDDGELGISSRRGVIYLYFDEGERVDRWEFRLD